MPWCYGIGKEGNQYGIIEIYYKKNKRYKLKGIESVTEFFHIGKSKQSVINDLKNILKNGNPKIENGNLNNSNYFYSNRDIRLMINDSHSKKRDIIDINNITNKNHDTTSYSIDTLIKKYI